MTLMGAEEISDEATVDEERKNQETESEEPDDKAERSDYGRPCPQCGATLIHRHCEYVCPNHGVIMDCADTFY
jgi:predicted RNA-binding Zn-ribbon protein involved in translation (DUF1610 family)